MTPEVGDRIQRRDRPGKLRLVTYVGPEYVILLNFHTLTFQHRSRHYIETRWERSQ